MRRFLKMPPQVFRIVLLAAFIVLAYSCARALLTPPSFGQYGFYRGAALEELAAREPLFAGGKACAECHDEEVKSLAAHDHKTLSCEACHGPGRAHASDPEVKVGTPDSAHCLRCHEANVSRPKWHKQVVSSGHYSDSKCAECHIGHNPKETP